MLVPQKLQYLSKLSQMLFSGSAYLSIDFKRLFRCLIYTSHLTPGWLKLGEENLILCI